MLLYVYIYFFGFFNSFSSKLLFIETGTGTRHLNKFTLLQHDSKEYKKLRFHWNFSRIIPIEAPILACTINVLHNMLFRIKIELLKTVVSLENIAVNMFFENSTELIELDYQQRVVKAFPGPGYLRSEDGVVWLYI